MLGFLIGLLLGGMVGIAVMALCTAAKKADENADRK